MDANESAPEGCDGGACKEDSPKAQKGWTCKSLEQVIPAIYTGPGFTKFVKRLALIPPITICHVNLLRLIKKEYIAGSSKEYKIIQCSVDPEGLTGGGVVDPQCCYCDTSNPRLSSGGIANNQLFSANVSVVNLSTTSGTSDIQHIILETGQGGIVSQGSSDCQAEVNYLSQGGIVASGVASNQVVFDHSVFGGLASEGQSKVKFDNAPNKGGDESNGQGKGNKNNK